jgi:hypothetical protein
MGWKMGVTVDRTPKCHPELARKGIEFSWACLKLFYWSLPIKEIKTKEAFKELVKKSLDWENVITTECVETFSRQAHHYTMAYFPLSQEAEQEAAQNGLGQLMQKIEQMKII